MDLNEFYRFRHCNCAQSTFNWMAIKIVWNGCLKSRRYKTKKKRFDRYEVEQMNLFICSVTLLNVTRWTIHRPWSGLANYRTNYEIKRIHKILRSALSNIKTEELHSIKINRFEELNAGFWGQEIISSHWIRVNHFSVAIFPLFCTSTLWCSCHIFETNDA